MTGVTRWVARATFQIEAMSLDMPVLTEANANRLPFRGILTQVDEPSTRPPNGSRDTYGRSHRVLIPRAVAEAALPSLMGMPVNCSAGLSDHDKQIVVGVITGAEIHGNDLVVSGHLLGKNFPEEVLGIQRNKDQLGMSYEISMVQVEDVEADIWRLTGLQFTGAAILLKRAAAYQHTAIAARAEEDPLMSGAVDTIMTKLNAIDTALLTLQASQQEDAAAEAAKYEEAAKLHDEEATRAEAQAIQAASDADEEDAKGHQETAAKARMAASSARLAAAKLHEDAAASLRAATHEEEAAQQAAETEAATHDEAAKRLRDEDGASKTAAEKAAADLAAYGTQHTEKDQDHWDKMMAGLAPLFEAMRLGGGKQDAAKDEKHADANMERMYGALGRFVAMTYMPGMMDGKEGKHDDEEQDLAMLRNLLRKGGDQSAQASRQPVVSLEEKRWRRQMQAATELLTDKVAKLTGLITDMVQSRRDLSTDGEHGVNGGLATRRTMAATTESWVDKYGEQHTQQARTDGKMTMAQIDASLDAAGITEPTDRIARKFTLQQQGKIAH
ncbi:MAG TPA: hypothetical protein VI542_24585 [Candidatus Tectomicrobia bacterium]